MEHPARIVRNSPLLAGPAALVLVDEGADADTARALRRHVAHVVVGDLAPAAVGDDDRRWLACLLAYVFGARDALPTARRPRRRVTATLLQRLRDRPAVCQRIAGLRAVLDSEPSHWTTPWLRAPARALVDALLEECARPAPPPAAAADSDSGFFWSLGFLDTDEK